MAGYRPSTPPKVPYQFNWNIYGGTIRQMQNLQNQYAANRFNYTPKTFQYSQQLADRNSYASEAQKRAQATVDARRIAGNANVANATSNYRLAQQEATANEGAGRAAIERQAELDAGRLSNMLTNAGVSGQGGAEQMYGLRGVAAQQIADNAVKYGLQRAQAAAQLAQSKTGFQADINAAQAQAYAEAQALQDQLYQQGFQNYWTGRNSAYNEFSNDENRAYQAALDAYQSNQNSLNNQLGVIGQIAGLQGQVAQNYYQDQWNRYNALYGRWQDVNSFAQNAAQSQQQYNQWLRSFNAQNTANNNSYNLAMNQFNQSNQPYPFVGGDGKNYIYNPSTGQITPA